MGYLSTYPSGDLLTRTPSSVIGRGQFQFYFFFSLHDLPATGSAPSAPCVHVLSLVWSKQYWAPPSISLDFSPRFFLADPPPIRGRCTSISTGLPWQIFPSQDLTPYSSQKRTSGRDPPSTHTWEPFKEASRMKELSGCGG
jgi:hypothetical protein